LGDFHRRTATQHDDDPTLYRGAKLAKGALPVLPEFRGHACGGLSQGGTLLASLMAVSPVPLGIVRPYLRDGTAPGLYSKYPSGENASGF
jgi:hypothetical protein